MKVDDTGAVVRVVDDQGAYIPSALKRGRNVLSWSYVRVNGRVIARENRGVIPIDTPNLSCIIRVDSKRRNGKRKYYCGWHICGGVPCYVDAHGDILCLYHDGVMMEVVGRGEAEHISFAAWKFAIGSRSAQTLADAAFNGAHHGYTVYVRPCQFRDRGVYTYDNA